jgi:hypothetical protein
LRIHRGRLTRADAEEGRVEQLRIVEETALADIGLAGGAGVGVVELLDVPAPGRREVTDAVPTGADQVPEVLRACHAAGEAAGHAHDRDRFVAGGHSRRRDGRGAAEDLVVKEVDQRGRGRVIVDEGRR